MSTAGMNPSLKQHFESNERAADYYSTHLKRKQIEALADEDSISLPDDNNKQEDCEVLLSEGTLEEFHRYNANLHGVGTSTILEGIRSLDEPKLSDISDNEMDDKYGLLVYLYEWDWEDRLDVIKTLKSFKNKRTYHRNTISGTKEYDELNDQVIEDIRDSVNEELPKTNDVRKHKILLKTIETVDEDEIVIRFLSESKSSKYEQFSFRTNPNREFSPDQDAEIDHIQYWPVKSEYVYIDYSRNEYESDLSKTENRLLKSIFSVLYEDPTWGDDVRFVDPLKFKSRTPKEFIDERVEEQKEKIEQSTYLDDGKKERYEEILEDLGTAEQTALTLENINVEGSPTTIHFETDESIEDFLQPHGWDKKVDEFNQKSQQREYTLEMGWREIHVGPSKLTITGDISKDEEHVITSLLREGGAII